jgi:hypothetical protein
VTGAVTAVQVHSSPRRRVILGMSAARADQMVSFHHMGDDSLGRLATTYRRAVEDGRVSDGTTPYSFAELLRQVSAIQRLRFRLRMRYGARCAYGPEGDRGTDVYDHYYRLDQPPSYALALAFDRARFNAGQSCILNWATPLPAVTPQRETRSSRRQAS